MPVVVAQVERQTIPVELHAIGTGQAFKTVSVESQVAAIVKDIHYQQGQFVKQGDLLVTLDDSPFVAALAQAEAALSKDKAQDQLNQAELQRYDELFKEGVVSKEQYDQTVATSAASQATVRSDEAVIQTAKIQLSYCSIYAPISGVTGAQLIYPGTTVKANDLPMLVVINQVSPIYVNFSVPQQYLESITRQLPVLGLVMDKAGKLGPQIQLHPADSPCTTVLSAPAEGPLPTVARGFPEVCSAVYGLEPSVPGRVRAGARNMTMEAIGTSFIFGPDNVDRPVMDKTGLAGKYDFLIEFAPTINGPLPAGSDFQPDGSGPTFVEALKDQLGLKLVPQTGPVDVLVIDHIEEPSPN